MSESNFSPEPHLATYTRVRRALEASGRVKVVDTFSELINAIPQIKSALPKEAPNLDFEIPNEFSEIDPEDPIGRFYINILTKGLKIPFLLYYVENKQGKLILTDKEEDIDRIDEEILARFPLRTKRGKPSPIGQAAFYAVISENRMRLNILTHIAIAIEGISEVGNLDPEIRKQLQTIITALPSSIRRIDPDPTKLLPEEQYKLKSPVEKFATAAICSLAAHFTLTLLSGEQITPENWQVWETLARIAEPSPGIK